VRLLEAEVRRVVYRLNEPFVLAHGTIDTREVVVLRLRTDVGDGWGECIPLSHPFTYPEYLDAAQQVIERFLLPAIFAAPALEAADAAALMAPVVGHPMAKSAVETALLDAELRAAGVSFAQRLGATRTHVEGGVALGLYATPAELVAAAERALADGYRRVKIKVKPGRDVELVRAVRTLGSDFGLHVDANGVYDPDDDAHVAALRALDDGEIAMIEQPFAAEELRALARLAAELQTPVCLDETIVSPSVAREALAMGAGSVAAIKGFRAGGYLQAKRVHDACHELGVPMFCSGMLESGLGLAANVALAALPGFTLPGDLWETTRTFAQDFVEAPTQSGGVFAVPDGPGLGVTPDPAALEALTVERRVHTAATVGAA
jgi:O-succinylbenzoate synthase